MLFERHRDQHQYMQQGPNADRLLMVWQVDQFNRLQQVMHKTPQRVKHLIGGQTLTRGMVHIQITQHL